MIAPAVSDGKYVVVLGEEWHTSWSMRLVSDLLYYRGLRDRVVMLWNANNTYGFNRIDWAPLNLASTVPLHASQMYAKNVSAFLGHIVQDGRLRLDFEDPIIRETCVTHAGEVRKS